MQDKQRVMLTKIQCIPASSPIHLYSFPNARTHACTHARTNERWHPSYSNTI